ncbi:MAG: hypothetical protein ACUVQY_10270 [Thermoproteota archaeon]
MHDPDVVILLFASGKLVCTGAVNEKMVYDAAEKLMAELIQKGLLIRYNDHLSFLTASLIIGSSIQ